MKYIAEFLKRGLMAAAGGPIVLAIVYGILGAVGVIETMTPFEVCKGIFSVTLLAFTVAGMTMIYTIERLPLFQAVLIHGLVLYTDYILIYLINGWLKQQLLPIAIFTIVFVLGYAIIWLIIYLSIRTKIQALNTQLRAQ